MNNLSFRKPAYALFAFAGFFVLASLSLSQTAVAQTAQECRGQTQRDMNACTYEAYQQADAKLNRLWRSIQNQFDGSDYDARTKSTLLKAQRAWLAYRDAHCEEFLASVQGGSGFPQFSATCLDTMTRARIAELSIHFD